METALIAIGSIVPMLLFLVVVHELGHFATARALGVADIAAAAMTCCWPRERQRRLARGCTC